MANKQTTFQRGVLKETADILGLAPSTAKYRILTGESVATKAYGEFTKGMADLRKKVKAKVEKLQSQKPN
jgi:hypothetical protein